MTPEQYIEQLAHSLYTGTHTGDVDSYLVHHSAQQLMQQCYTGWGKSFDTPGIEAHDFEQLKNFEENIYTFSAFKNHRFITECTSLLKNNGGKKPTYDEFLAGVKKISNTYHNKYAAKEADNVLTTVKAIKQWQTILKQKEEWPYLTWQVDKKDSTCKVCNSLNNTCLPVEHPFWAKHFIPAHYGCHCKIIQGNNAAQVTPDKDIPTQVDHNGKKICERNMGIGGVIFNSSLPYIKDLKAGLSQIRSLLKGILPHRLYNYPPVSVESFQQLNQRGIHFFSIGQKLSPEKAFQIFTKCNTDFHPVEFITQMDVATAGISNQWISRNFYLNNINTNKHNIRLKLSGTDFYFEKSIQIKQSGASVYIERFVIDEKYTSAGISQKVMQANYRQDKKMKVKSISLEAGLQNGGYVWAKYDFRAKDKDDVNTILWKAKDRIDDADYKLAEKIYNKYYLQKPEGKDFPIRNIAGLRSGKEILMKRYWKGIVNLQDEENKELFENYMNFYY